MRTAEQGAPLAAGRLTDERVEAALRRVIDAGEVGVAVAAYLGEEPIVDTWIGTLDGDGAHPVDDSTLFPIFSISKAITAAAVHLQAERGLIDYDAPLARYWPEYGSHGKDRVTVAHVLAHRAGVPQMPDRVTPELLMDWDWMVAALAEAEPVLEPGTANTYLSMVFGWLLGEVVRRTDPQHRPFGRFIDEEIAQPLGMDSFWLGTPPQVRSRVATLSFPSQPPPPPEGTLVRRAVPPQVVLGPLVFNRADIQQACIPAVGGISSARSLVRFFAMLANGGQLDGVRLFSEQRVRWFGEPRPDFEAHDETYGRMMPVGIGGFWVRAPGVTPDGVAVIGHTGAGSSVAWAEPDKGLSVAFCHNRMVGGATGHPFSEVAQAIREFAADRR